jgi:hypothetical protein
VHICVCKYSVYVHICMNGLVYMYMYIYIDMCVYKHSVCVCVSLTYY